MWQNRTGLAADGDYLAVGGTATELGKGLQS